MSSIRMVHVIVSEMTVGVMRQALLSEGEKVQRDRLGRPSERAAHMAEIQIALDALDNVEVLDAEDSKTVWCKRVECLGKVRHAEHDAESSRS